MPYQGSVVDNFPRCRLNPLAVGVCICTEIAGITAVWAKIQQFKGQIAEVLPNVGPHSASQSPSYALWVWEWCLQMTGA